MWLLQEYAMYWYGLGVVLLVVFGVAEVARLWAPLRALEIVGLLFLAAVVVAAGLVGYLLLWRRDSGAARWILGGLSRLKPPQSNAATREVPVAPDPHGEAEGPNGRA